MVYFETGAVLKTFFMEAQMKIFVMALTLVFACAAVPLALEAASATGSSNTGIGKKQTSGTYMKGKTSVQKKQGTSSDNSTAPEAR
jgi:hypothetical protein